MTCHSHVAGWLPVEPSRPNVVRAWAWGCLNCKRIFGRGPGTIRLTLRNMIDEDVAVWEMDS